MAQKDYMQLQTERKRDQNENIDKIDVEIPTVQMISPRTKKSDKSNKKSSKKK